LKRALIFDCDGVLADTEADGHLVAFNQMWRELGVPWQWGREEYGRKLRFGGGKERMASLFDDADFLAVYSPPEREHERRELIAAWHRRKTSIYGRIVESGALAPRPGVRRIAAEALAAGWTLAVASTSAPESVAAVLRHTMGEELAGRFALVVAGDVVKAKKPAPDIYLLASERLGIPPNDCVAIEDSANGLQAAVEAGMRCVVTVSAFTAEEDFSRASLVVTCLGDAGSEPCRVLANRWAAAPGAELTVRDLEAILTARPAAQGGCDDANRG